MIAGPTDGVYLNIPHYLGYVWSQDSFLSGVIPITEEESTNRFHLYGIDHITDEELLSFSGPYGIIQDLVASTTVRASAQASTWAHRVSLYASGMTEVTSLMNRFLQLLEGTQATTSVGAICSIDSGAKQFFQSVNHYAARVTLEIGVVNYTPPVIVVAPAEPGNLLLRLNDNLLLRGTDKLILRV